MPGRGRFGGFAVVVGVTVAALMVVPAGLPGDRSPVVFARSVASLGMDLLDAGRSENGADPATPSSGQAVRLSPADPRRDSEFGPWPDPVSNASNLELPNNTTGPLSYVGSGQANPTGVAYDPSLGRVFTAAGETLSLNASLEDSLAVVDPSSGLDVGTFATPGCWSWAEEGLVFDASTGLLYLLCEEGFVQVLDPANGSVVTNISLGSPAPNGSCAGLAPFPQAATLVADPSELAVLELTCSSVPPYLNASIVLLNLLTDSESAQVALGPSVFGLDWLNDREPLAFDAASGQLYAVANYSAVNDSVQIDIVDPASGAVIASLFYPFLAAEAAPSLLFDPILGDVLLEGRTSATASVPALLRLIGPTNRTLPLVEWPVPSACTGSGDSACPPVLEPGALTLGAGDGSEVAIELQSSGGPALLRVYNVSTGLMLDNLTLGATGPGVYDPLDGELLLPSADSEGRLFTVSGVSAQEGQPVLLDANVFATAVDPADGTVYVAWGPPCGSSNLYPPEGGCVNTSEISVIPLSTREISYSWPAPPGLPSDILFDPTNREIYVLSACGEWSDAPTGCFPDNSTSALTAYSLGGQLLKTVPLGSGNTKALDDAGRMVLSPSTGEIVIAGEVDHGATDVELVNTSTYQLVAGPVLSDALGPYSLTLDPALDLLFEASGCLVEIGGSPDYAYRTCLWAVNVSAGSVEWSVTGTYGPGTVATVAFDARNDTLLFSNGTGVDLLDPQNGTQLGTLSVNGSVSGLAYDPVNNAIYAIVYPSLGNSELEQLNASTGTVLLQVGVPAVAGGPITVDPANGVAVLAGPYTDSVSIVPGVGPTTYAVLFPESGLPTSVRWSVLVGGEPVSGAGPLTAYLPNGTYPYSISVSGYNQSTIPPQGNLTVDGSSLTMPTLVFTEVLSPLVFVSLVFGPSWNVSVAPAGSNVDLESSPSCSSLGTVCYLVPNGTYRYVISGVPPNLYIANRTGAGAGVGSVVVDHMPGQTGTDVVFFIDYAVNPVDRKITLHESGLPPRSDWCATLGGALSRCSDRSTITWSALSPGNYSYSVSIPAGYTSRASNGTVVLANSSRSVGVRFSVARYQVTLSEVGLQPRTPWRLTLGGRSYASRSTEIALSLPNGTYSYSAARVPNYLGAPSGEIVVNGSAVALGIRYAPVAFAVTFVETGLGNGSNWTVRIDGITYRSETSTLVVPLVNGTYSYRLPSYSDFTRTASPKRVDVDGAPVTVTVTYRFK